MPSHQGPGMAATSSCAAGPSASFFLPSSTNSGDPEKESRVPFGRELCDCELDARLESPEVHPSLSEMLAAELQRRQCRVLSDAIIGLSDGYDRAVGSPRVLNTIPGINVDYSVMRYNCLAER
ncbi:hypothetical protein V1505DRAFT_380031 [Lipomyces doorenjongii]